MLSKAIILSIFIAFHMKSKKTIFKILVVLFILSSIHLLSPKEEVYNFNLPREPYQNFPKHWSIERAEYSEVDLDDLSLIEETPNFCEFPSFYSDQKTVYAIQVFGKGIQDAQDLQTDPNEFKRLNSIFSVDKQALYVNMVGGKGCLPYVEKITGMNVNQLKPMENKHATIGDLVLSIEYDGLHVTTKNNSH